MGQRKRNFLLFPLVLTVILAILVVLTAALLKNRQLIGPSEVSIKRTASGKNGDAYQLLVNGQPYLIRGACYTPIPVGKDYEFNFWGDPQKPWLTDGQMMKAAGVNTVRLYRMGKDPVLTRRVLDDLYRKFGLHVLAGSYLGFWNWPPPNYSDAAFQEKERSEMIKMVKLYKDHPAILMWVLGNENNYSFDRNLQRWSNARIDAIQDKEEQRRERAKIYYQFINSLAKDIKAIDPKHLVVLGVGEIASLDLAAQYAPQVDVIGMLAYRGASFGSLFRQIRQRFDKPVVMIEWGADSFNAVSREPDEDAQAEFIKSQWQEIERNVDPKKGIGNSLGGTIFEWTDEWWKSSENFPRTWSMHDTAAHWGSASYYFDADVPGGLNMNEEWWGVVSLEPSKKANGANRRVPKKAYYVLKQLWTAKKTN